MNIQEDTTDVSTGAVVAALVFGAALLVPIFMASGNAAASTNEPATAPDYIIKGGNTCGDAVVKGLGTARVDGAYALRQVLDQGTNGEVYLSHPITVPRLLQAGDSLLVVGPLVTPGENAGTFTLTVTQFDDEAKIERLATTARDVIRPTLAECTDRGEEMPDYYPENFLIDQRAHQPA